MYDAKYRWPSDSNSLDCIGPYVCVNEEDGSRSRVVEAQQDSDKKQQDVKLSDYPFQWEWKGKSSDQFIASRMKSQFKMMKREFLPDLVPMISVIERLPGYEAFIQSQIVTQTEEYTLNTQTRCVLTRENGRSGFFITSRIIRLWFGQWVLYKLPTAFDVFLCNGSKTYTS